LIAPCLRLNRWRLRRVELPDQIGKTVGYPLTHDIVVHGPELVPDSGLDFGVEAALLARFGLYIFHDLFHASPGVKSLKLQENIAIFESFTGTQRGLMQSSLESSQTGWNFYRA
jgi:hypothetical protein